MHSDFTIRACKLLRFHFLNDFNHKISINLKNCKTSAFLTNSVNEAKQAKNIISPRHSSYDTSNMNSGMKNDIATWGLINITFQDNLSLFTSIIYYFFSPAVDSGDGLTILSWPPSLLAAVAAFTSLQWLMNLLSSWFNQIKKETFIIDLSK
jgi:hypothetical protein